ncbi:multicopper oxidase domain-containing protein [Geopsychrobacter electrodiphilus]|uniref:multicopper oxidase domain-containing protein n=1 Tax=Geopsychrobacter electrodiphilus TaxID=225196 RepID=UPI0003802A11|nr:hypothetical protein [Geopsychrobacter electrodiphilus]
MSPREPVSTSIWPPLFWMMRYEMASAPLKHAVFVAPQSTTVIEFDVNEVGDWFFYNQLLTV